MSTASDIGVDGPDIVIIGAGFGGICTAIELQRAGIDDFVILEKSAEIGGTWRENTYPGCSCDVTAMLYSFSFDQNPNWTRMFAPQSEILEYMRGTVDRHGLRPRLRLSAEVVAMDFDDEDNRWRVRTADGVHYRPRIVIPAQGGLCVPSIPKFPGRESFAGRAFHSAEWDHEFDPTGKRIAVIGTGASAVQFVPELAKRAEHLTVFQRTPHWMMPKPDRRLSRLEHRIYRSVPGAQRLVRWGIYWMYESTTVAFMKPKLMPGLELIARLHLRHQVRDPELRANLTPDYQLGCKRILVSNDYYPALQRDNVSLMTEQIEEITPAGIITTGNGIARDFDAIVYGTGFNIIDRLRDEHIVGAKGLRIQDAFNGAPEAFLGVACHGFPNMFLVLGPNSGGGNQSIVFMIEAQARYIRQCVQLMRRTGTTRMEVREDRQSEFNRRAQEKLAGAVWGAGGCKSWYLAPDGRNLVAWPGSSASFWYTLRRPDPTHYDLSAATDRDKRPETWRYDMGMVRPGVAGRADEIDAGQRSRWAEAGATVSTTSADSTRGNSILTAVDHRSSYRLSSKLLHLLRR